MSAWLLGEGHKVAVSLLRLLVAAVMGTLMAYHPRRRPRMLDEERQNTAKTQVLMAVAAAVMVQVIGESTARAFGLLGLGSSVRFRTNVQSPIDAAVLFLSMGVGMASGLAEYRLSVTIAVFVFIALFFIDPSRKEILGHEKKSSLGDRR